MRIDDLARQAGVATTTVRLYRSKGLLPPPRLVGRTGFYGPEHLARLQAIARLQQRGFSLAGIAELLARWDDGEPLGGLLGIHPAGAASVVGADRSLTLWPAELAERMPAAAFEPETVRRAVDLGLLELLDDGRVRVPDERFLDTGSALIDLGVPVEVVLDEWSALSDMTERVANRFADVFEHHLLEDGDGAHRPVPELVATLSDLRANAEQVLLAAFDRALTTIAVQRFADLVEPLAGDHPAP